MDYLKLSELFMKDAKALLEEYRQTKNEERLRQACEKGFGAFSQILMYYKGRDVRHKEFRDVIEELFLKTNNRDIIQAHIDAESLHGSFYDGTLSHVEVDEALRQIDRGIEAIKSLKGSESIHVSPHLRHLGQGD